MATEVKVIYHYEDGAWWANSPDIDRWSAAADELEQLVGLVDEGVRFALERDDVNIEHLPAPELMDIFAGRTAAAQLRIVSREAFFEMVRPEVFAADVVNPNVLVA